MTEKTSAEMLERHIRGRLLVGETTRAPRDVIAKIFAREREQESFIVPAVAEPLLVWILSGSATVEERDMRAHFPRMNEAMRLIDRCPIGSATRGPTTGTVMRRLPTGSWRTVSSTIVLALLRCLKRTWACLNSWSASPQHLAGRAMRS